MNEYLMTHLIKMYHEIDELLTPDSQTAVSIDRQLPAPHQSEPL